MPHAQPHVPPAGSRVPRLAPRHAHTSRLPFRNARPHPSALAPPRSRAHVPSVAVRAAHPPCLVPCASSPTPILGPRGSPSRPAPHPSQPRQLTHPLRPRGLPPRLAHLPATPHPARGPRGHAKSHTSGLAARGHATRLTTRPRHAVPSSLALHVPPRRTLKARASRPRHLAHPSGLMARAPCLAVPRPTPRGHALRHDPTARAASQPSGLAPRGAASRATRHAPRATRHAPRATRHAPRATGSWVNVTTGCDLV
jgi:hypothetical protein